VSAWIVSKTHIDLLIAAGQQMVARQISNGLLHWYAAATDSTWTRATATR